MNYQKWYNEVYRNEPDDHAYRQYIELQKAYEAGYLEGVKAAPVQQTTSEVQKPLK